MKDVYRYDLPRKKLEKLADLHTDMVTCGASAHGKIFVAESPRDDSQHGKYSNTCEVYDETANEWQLIAGLNMPCAKRLNILSVFSADNKLYGLHALVSDLLRAKLECYHPDKDEWKEVTEIPNCYVKVAMARGRPLPPGVRVDVCSIKVFKGLLNSSDVQKKASSSRPYLPAPPPPVFTC